MVKKPRDAKVIEMFYYKVILIPSPRANIYLSTAWMSYMKQERFILREHLCSQRWVVGGCIFLTMCYVFCFVQFGIVRCLVCPLSPMFLDCPLLISLSAIAAVYLVETNIDCTRECVSKYYSIPINMDFLVYIFPSIWTDAYCCTSLCLICLSYIYGLHCSEIAPFFCRI